MQVLPVLPGFRPDAVNSAVFESLSVSATVPADHVLRLLWLVPTNPASAVRQAIAALARKPTANTELATHRATAAHRFPIRLLFPRHCSVAHRRRWGPRKQNAQEKR